MNTVGKLCRSQGPVVDVEFENNVYPDISKMH